MERSKVVGRKSVHAPGGGRRVELHLDCGHRTIEMADTPGKVGDDVECVRCAPPEDAEAQRIEVYLFSERLYKARCTKCRWESALGERGFVAGLADRHRCR